MTTMPRLLLFSLIGLLAGIGLAAGVQIGSNVLRYLVQPMWLDGAISRLLLFMTGAVAALLMGSAFGYFTSRALKSRHAFILIALGVGTGFLLDPYYLAELGWRTPILLETYVRALSILLPALGLAVTTPEFGLKRGPFWLFATAAIFGQALLPRFALVPVLGGDLDLAAMTPVHVLVFARGLLFLIIAMAGAQLIQKPRPTLMPGGV